MSFTVIDFSAKLCQSNTMSSAPQQEIKLKLCPTKPKNFALADFNHFLPKPQMILLYFKEVMSFLKEKTNNQDIFVVVLTLICAWQTSILLWLSSLIAGKVIFLCLL